MALTAIRAQRVLVADDGTRALEVLTGPLRSRRADLDIDVAAGAADAHERLAGEAYDVVAADAGPAGDDGAALLEHVRLRQPQAVRVVVSDEASPDAALRLVPVAHLAITRPCAPADLERALDRAAAVRTVLDVPALRAVIHRVGVLPSPPGLAGELLAALDAPDLDIADVAATVARDVALSAKVLQLVNSSFFGLSRQLTDVHDAVVYLGLGLIRTLALSGGAIEEFRPAPPLEHFDLARLQDHAGQVSRLAGALAAPGAPARMAASIGLLQHIGLLVLASRVPGVLESALELARADAVPLADAERATIGATHGPVGAYLLALWGLPQPVVQAIAAFEEDPAAVLPATGLEPLDAVRVADACVTELAGGVVPGLSPSAGALTLERLGPAERRAGWRAVAAETLTGAGRTP